MWKARERSRAFFLSCDEGAPGIFTAQKRYIITLIAMSAMSVTVLKE
jgi:hypothetical protein